MYHIVWTCVWSRETERECVCVKEWERVCVCLRDREWVCVCVIESVCVRVYVIEWARECSLWLSQHDLVWLMDDKGDGIPSHPMKRTRAWPHWDFLWLREKPLRFSWLQLISLNQSSIFYIDLYSQGFCLWLITPTLYLVNSKQTFKLREEKYF